MSEAALHARDVVEDQRVAGVRIERLPENRQRALVVLLAVQAEEAGHRLARAGRPCLSGGAADGEDDRAVLGRAGAPLCRRVADEDSRATRCADLLAVDRERARALDHDVELLMTARARTELVVLADDGRALLGLVVGVHAERADLEVAAKSHTPAAAVFGSGRAAEAEPALRRLLGCLAERDDGVRRRCRCCHAEPPLSEIFRYRATWRRKIRRQIARCQDIG